MVNKPDTKQSRLSSGYYKCQDFLRRPKSSQPSTEIIRAYYLEYTGGHRIYVSVGL